MTGPRPPRSARWTASDPTPSTYGGRGPRARPRRGPCTGSGTRLRVGLGRSARSLLTPVGVCGAAVECAWVATHLALYPLGFARQRVRDAQRLSVADLSPVQRGLLIGDVEAAGTPILLLHGMVDNCSIFTLLRRGLRRRGFGQVLTTNYSPLTGDIRTAAAQLADEVEQLCADTGYERIHVVGHSLGGIIARYYVQRLGGDVRVHTLVTLGAPHGGTWPAHLLPHALMRQLRPGSDIVADLAAPAPGCRTRFVAFWSDLDQMIVPKRAARVEHGDLHRRNVFVRGVGHMSLPIDGRVVHEISTTLAHLDSSGTTVTRGVTTIAERQHPGVRPPASGVRAAPPRRHRGDLSRSVSLGSPR
jgi:triacylglycerol lipase